MRIYLFISLLLTAASATAQTTFFRLIGETASPDMGIDIVQTHDKRYAVVSYLGSNPPVNDIVHTSLTKTDENGELLWTRQISDDDSSSVPNRMIETSDHGFLIVGTTGSLGNFADLFLWVHKTDADGNMEWSYRYETTKRDIAHDVYETNDGYLIAGIINDNVADRHISVLKISKLGDIIWNRSYTIENGSIVPRRMAVFPDGSFVVAGVGINHVAGGLFPKIALSKFTADGTAQWCKFYRLTYDTEPSAIRIDKYDNIVVSGYGYTEPNLFDGILFRTDKDGLLKNELFFHAGDAAPGGNPGDFIRAFDFAEDEKLVTFGHYGSDMQMKPTVMKTDWNGVIDFSRRTVLLPGYTSYLTSGIFIKEDQTVAFTGTFRQTPSIIESGIVKTDRNGNIGCYSQEYAVELAEHHLDITDYELVPGNFTYQRTAANIIEHPNFITEKTLCEFIPPIAGFDTTAIISDCPNYCFDFGDTSKNAPTQWEWSFPGGTPAGSTDQHPAGICFSAGIYTIRQVAINDDGSDTAFFQLTVNGGCPVQVPNVFTPNADGKNDLFSIPGLPDEFSLSIFNRWGNKVFETGDQTTMWNGQVNNTGNLVPEGVYYYVLEFPDQEDQSGFLHVFF